jgi:hypothetical protein
MKISTILSLAIAVAASTNMFAADLNRMEIQNLKEQPQFIMITSSNRVVATMTINRSGTLVLEAEKISQMKSPQLGFAYNSKGKAKLEMLVDGKPELTISGDSITVQEKISNSKAAK